jgi:ABC-type multidrug transport system ATPase subunit
VVELILAKPPGIIALLAGLDVNTRPTLLSVLQSLHETCKPRIIMGLRMQDPVPDWISHVALVRGGTVATGTKDEILSKHADHHAREAEHRTASTTQSYLQPGLEHCKPVVGMKNVNVSYDTRKATTSSLIMLTSLIRSLGAQKHQLDNPRRSALASSGHEWCVNTLLANENLES